MKIRFWGTRGSIPTPGPNTVRYGGNTACVEVRDSGGALLVLDAGTGLRELGIAMMNGGSSAPFEVDLLLSHLHWDHIQGIPFFRPAFDPKGRLRIIGPKQSRTMKDLLGLGMDDPFFPVDIDDLPVQLKIDEMSDGSDERLGPFRVRAEFLPGDFKATWGHSTVDAAVDIAVKARVGRLVLYHHDPDRSDDALDRIGRDAQRAASQRRPGLEVVVAREGLELTI